MSRRPPISLYLFVPYTEEFSVCNIWLTSHQGLQTSTSFRFITEGEDLDSEMQTKIHFILQKSGRFSPWVITFGKLNRTNGWFSRLTCNGVDVISSFDKAVKSVSYSRECISAKHYCLNYASKDTVTIFNHCFLWIYKNDATNFEQRAILHREFLSLKRCCNTAWFLKI